MKNENNDLKKSPRSDNGFTPMLNGLKEIPEEKLFSATFDRKFLGVMLGCTAETRDVPAYLEQYVLNDTGKAELYDRRLTESEKLGLYSNKGENKMTNNYGKKLTKEEMMKLKETLENKDILIYENVDGMSFDCYCVISKKDTNHKFFKQGAIIHDSFLTGLVEIPKYHEKERITELVFTIDEALELLAEGNFKDGDIIETLPYETLLNRLKEVRSDIFKIHVNFKDVFYLGYDFSKNPLEIGTYSLEVLCLEDNYRPKIKYSIEKDSGLSKNGIPLQYLCVYNDLTQNYINIPYNDNDENQNYGDPDAYIRDFLNKDLQQVIERTKTKYGIELVDL